MDNMNIVNFKQNIYRENKIPEILEKLGCKFVKEEQNGSIFTAALPEGNNKRSVQVKNNSFLNACIRSKGINGIDIFDIVSYIKFQEETKDDMRYSRDYSINWVKKILNIKIKDYDTNDLDWIKKINHNIKTNEPINSNYLNKYFPIPHKLWLDEGISSSTQRFFKISYNIDNNQIIIPIYDKDNNLIGIKARNLDDSISDEKYIYIKPCNARLNLYGLNIAKKFIKKDNRIIIFEGEKSVMKAFQYGYRESVALGCKDITKNQILLLQEFIDNDTEIIFGFDKDVYINDNKYKYNHLNSIYKLFPNNKVSFLIDRKNLLDKKDSPVDKGKDVFIRLLEHKETINDIKNIVKKDRR